MKGSVILYKNRISRHTVYLALLLLLTVCFMSGNNPLPATAEGELPLTINAVDVKATSLVYGEESRYILAVTANDAINLSAGATVMVDFPKKAGLICNDIENENPGCTLVNIQYKAKSTDKSFAYLDGQVSTSTTSTETQRCSLALGGNANTVPADTKLYITIPGVMNKPAVSGDGSGGGNNNNITVTIHAADGKTFLGTVNKPLSNAPANAPTGLQVTALGSSSIDASWSQVEGATRYQLLYSWDPDGTFIQAYDFDRRDPNPDELWSIPAPVTTTDTATASFSGGNSGLLGGRTYYFKVKAGNDFGYGPNSEPEAVSTSVISPSTMIPLAKASSVTINSPISVTLDQDVTIANKHYIQIYEKATGTPIDSTSSANGSTVTIQASLKADTQYQVVFFYQALTATANNKVWNESFDWVFTTAKGGN